MIRTTAAPSPVHPEEDLRTKKTGAIQTSYRSRTGQPWHPHNPHELHQNQWIQTTGEAAATEFAGAMGSGSDVPCTVRRNALNVPSKRHQSFQRVKIRHCSCGEWIFSAKMISRDFATSSSFLSLPGAPNSWMPKGIPAASTPRGSAAAHASAIVGP